LTIWVDADSCPVPVRTMIERFALRLKLPVMFVANRKIPHTLREAKIGAMPPLFTSIVTESVPDAADDYIVEHAGQDDMAITRDIPLANRLVERGIAVLNDRGVQWTPENIRERLSERNFNMALVEMGAAPERTGMYGKRDLNRFANCLDKTIRQITADGHRG
jgi:uncharacterized protein YaiI (UPF0178 family)